MKYLDYLWMVPTLALATLIGCLMVGILYTRDKLKDLTWLLAVLWFAFLVALGLGDKALTFTVGFLLLAAACAALFQSNRHEP